MIKGPSPGAQSPSRGSLAALDHGGSHVSQGTLAAGLCRVRAGATPVPYTPQAVQRGWGSPSSWQCLSCCPECALQLLW